MWQDTIAAPATPPGEGGVAIVRVSGPASGEIGRAVLRALGGGPVSLEPRLARLARLVGRDGAAVDEVLALWMPGPASYTREDVLELHCHGGRAAAGAVLDAVLGAGARLAEPGEFTFRAFANGRLDLVQAEAVLDVIRARTEGALRVHGALLGGGLSREAEGWQGALEGVLAPLEAHLDFPEEELGSLDVPSIGARLREVRGALEEKLAGFGRGRAARDGFTVALVGSPNVGKSSLLNRLAGHERAIVSPEPGTTRDTVEAWIEVGGVPMRVVDTAGLREAAGAVEGEGVRRARAAAEAADLVVYVGDGSRGLSAEELAEARALGEGGRALGLVNKGDLGSAGGEALAAALGGPVLTVSAVTGEGIGAVVGALARAAQGPEGAGDEAPLTRLRHRDLVAAARDAVARAEAVLAAGGYPEVAASELHGARRSLAALIGVGTPEDVLAAVFREFCVGK